MKIARPAEQAVLEMVMLEIDNGMRHVRLARKERLLPDHCPVPANPADAAHISGKLAEAQLGRECRLAQFGVGEPQIIATLGDMVGKFVAHAKAQAERLAVIADQIDARDLGFFAAVLGKGGHGERRFGSGENRAITLVEPFGLHPGHARRRLAALFAHQEHAHRIGQVFAARRRLVHLVAPFGGPKVRETSAGNQQMGSVGMIDRRQQGQVSQLDWLAEALLRQFGER